MRSWIQAAVFCADTFSATAVIRYWFIDILSSVARRLTALRKESGILTLLHIQMPEKLRQQTQPFQQRQAAARQMKRRERTPATITLVSMATRFFMMVLYKMSLYTTNLKLIKTNKVIGTRAPSRSLSSCPSGLS
jgi:hypothetical protein